MEKRQKKINSLRFFMAGGFFFPVLFLLFSSRSRAIFGQLLFGGIKRGLRFHQPNQPLRFINSNSGPDQSSSDNNKTNQAEKFGHNYSRLCAVAEFQRKILGQAIFTFQES